MTKYVVNSGGLRKHPTQAAHFLAEMAEGKGPNPKMLIALFAQPREDWEKNFVKYTTEFTSWATEGIKFTFELAFPDTFTTQVAACDILYIHGGDNHLLKYWLRQFDIPKIWDGKTIGTSSAGSNMLSTQYWNTDWRSCGDGFDILPIKFLPHFESAFGSDDPIRGPINWQVAYDELVAYGDPSLPIHALKEGEFIVIENKEERD